MAGEDVEYPTEYMNTLANTRQTTWETSSHDGLVKIRDGAADEASFGDLQRLKDYGRVFTEVRQIYVETMRGAKADLDAVAEGIKTSARQMKDHDDTAGAAFVELWQKWERGPLESTSNQEQASSTPAAQEAAATAASAETPGAETPGEQTPGGEVPTGENPDTQSEGEVPVSGPGQEPPLP
ncbi:hypothetical protein JNB_05784 [Janibacter sp. HTCC2649]|uniref:hypothetical protein n=1 Tax=Janibacter sp. HTCC2649 TaxID=313589 RepID=UPI0000670CC7|nr:hypothetical protein [Janibacter sp. HTCC2649]EAP99654.1 hypothetical protein JNB_05784 [Janibacter sp. HTCC2649]